MRSHLRTVLVLAAAVLLLALFLRQADFRSVLAEIRGARPWALIGALLATAVTYVIRAGRWQYLLRPLGRTRFRIAFRTTVIGFAASSLLPARAGEVIRPYLLARQERLSVTSTFATIVLERLLDLLAILALFLVFVLTLQPSAAFDQQLFGVVKVGGAITAVGALVALALMYGLAGAPQRVEQVTERLGRMLPPRMAEAVGAIALRFVQGFAVVRQPRRLAAAIAWSVPLWLSIGAGIWLVTVAFRMEVPVLGTLLILAVLAVGVSVPTPGAVGGFHEAFRLAATTFYGVENDRAVGAAIVLHAISFAPVAVVGIVFLLQDGMSLTRVRSIAEREMSAPAGATGWAGRPHEASMGPTSPGSERTS